MAELPVISAEFASCCRLEGRGSLAERKEGDLGYFLASTLAPLSLISREQPDEAIKT